MRRVKIKRSELCRYFGIEVKKTEKMIGILLIYFRWWCNPSQVKWNGPSMCVSLFDTAEIQKEERHLRASAKTQVIYENRPLALVAS